MWSHDIISTFLSCLAFIREWYQSNKKWVQKTIISKASLLVRVIGKGERMNSCRVALQVESSCDFFKLSSLPEANLPHLDVSSETT